MADVAPRAVRSPGGSGTLNFAIYAASVAALGGLLFGYDSAVINGAVGAIGQEFHSNPATLGLAVSSALVGAAIGALSTGRIADRYGRLTPMRLAALSLIVSAVGAGLANSLTLLSIFRLIGGVGVGIASVIAPTYIAEVVPAKIRGRLGSLQQLAIVLGIFFSLLVDYAIASAAGSSTATWAAGLAAWRWMFLVMVIPALVYCVLSFTVPESPRFLVAQGRLPEARAIIGRLLGVDAVDIKLQQIRDSLASERTATWSDLRGPALGLLPIVWVGIALSVFQQFSGINVIFYYSSVLWHAVGFSERDSLLITVITSVVNIVSTFVAIALIDRVGRRALLLFGSAGMAVTLGVLTYVFGNAPLDAHHQPQLDHTGGLIALWAANLFVVSFAVSWGPAVWVLLGEVFSNHIRAAALSVAAAAQWVANWAITVSFPTLQQAGLGLAYGLYTAFAALSFIFVLSFVRETNGTELEDVPR
jgi:SP family sugar:H+ symporter-like MFS transporter